MELVETLADALMDCGGVETVYLFGSHAKGTARQDSDLDLAVLFTKGLSQPTILDVRAHIEAAVHTRMPHVHVDIVDLDRVGATVAFYAIRDGELLLDRDPKRRIRRGAQIARRYDDEAPRRRMFRRAAVRAGRNMAVQ